VIFVLETIASNWSTWQSWSPCSTTCGKGVKSRKRLCIGSNNGGCSGPEMEKVECGKKGDGEGNGCPDD